MYKPEHLSRAVGDQFADKTIVENYSFRPIYSDEVINCLSHCLGISGMSVLDIGSGTGEISIPLSQRGHSVIGVDPSSEMVKAADAKGSNVVFVNAYIEDFKSESKFNLFVAANSIHWPDWRRMFPLLRELSEDGAKLAIVTGGDLVIDSIKDQLFGIIKKYSTTRNFKPYSIIDMLQSQGYIENIAVQCTVKELRQQSIENYIASCHARNGFSLDRMEPRAAEAFDAELMALLTSNNFLAGVEGEVEFNVSLVDIVAP